MPDDVPTERFDFESKGIEGWTTVEGHLPGRTATSTCR